MKFYDLHMHSVLSPCGDYLMTPNNILNMAMLNKLDIIAVTDHNSMLQLQTIKELSESYDFLIVYGCEVQVEGGHLLIYFINYDEAMRFQQYLDQTLLKESYDADKYGEQIVCNVFDETLYTVDYYLLGDMQVSFKQLLLDLNDYNCIKVAAHIDKHSYSLLDKLTIELSNYIDGIEVVNENNLDEIYKVYPHLKSKFVFKNSDAHQLTDINEDNNTIELKDLTTECLFEVIKGE